MSRQRITSTSSTEMMDTGLFRQDLYYRLNVIQLKMPALRDRPADIPLLANLLLSKLCTAQQIDVPRIEPAAQTYIAKLPFPGNVRELENMLERALALCDGETITVGDLLIDDNSHHSNKLDAGLFSQANNTDLNLTDYLEEVEKKAIIQALDKTNNNKTAAAKLLGVTFRTFRYRLAKLGLSKEEISEADGDGDPTAQ